MTRLVRIKKKEKKKPTNKKQRDFTSLFLSLRYKIIPRTVILPYLIAALEYHLESLFYKAISPASQSLWP